MTRADTPPPRKPISLHDGESAGLGETQLTGQGNPDAGYSLAEAPTPARSSTSLAAWAASVEVNSVSSA